MDIFQSLSGILSPFFTGLLIAAGVGLIIGLEREFSTHGEKGHIGGIRTFTLISVLGYCAAWVGKQGEVAVLYTIMAAFLMLSAFSYRAQVAEGKVGLTTPLAMLMALMLGVFIAAGYVREALAVVVLFTLVLSLKEELHSFIRQITTEELNAFIKFIVLALLILPMLPDQSFGPEGILNARDMGWIAVLVLSLSFAGYLLLKFGRPDKGILLTALVGGLFSSTMIAWVFAARSKEHRALAQVFGAGIVLASSIMFVRVAMLTALFAWPVSIKLMAPLFTMLLASLIPVWQWRRSNHGGDSAGKLSPGNPLDLKNALLFVLLYIGISLFMYGSRQWLGPQLTYLSGALAGIADIDAISIATSKWAGTDELRTREASRIILLAVMSNSLFKLMVSHFWGDRALRPPVWIGFGAVLVAGLVWVVWM